MKRILPFLFLLPLLMTSAACTHAMPSAIANDDRPSSPQPAIASPIAAPPTIESLAGTYIGAIDEKAVKEEAKSRLDDDKKQGITVEQVEQILRQLYGGGRITINVDGTFELDTDRLEQHGKVKIDGNKLIFTDDSIDSTNGSANAPKLSDPCSFMLCTFMLYVAADRKTLLLNESPNPADIIRGYVKQQPMEFSTKVIFLDLENH